jgi:hypothetical protein
MEVRFRELSNETPLVEVKLPLPINAKKKNYFH